MKMKEFTEDECSAEQIEADDWAVKALEVVGTFPIVTKIMKNMGGTKQKSILLGRRFESEAEYIKDYSKATRKFFSTLTEVHRAAHYLGMRLLYQSVKGSFPADHPIHAIDKSFQVMEKSYTSYQVLSMITEMLEQVIISRNHGIESRPKTVKIIQAIILNAPEAIRPLLEENWKKLEAGEKVIDLYTKESRQWGGERAGAGRKS